MPFFLSCNFWIIRQERRQLEHLGRKPEAQSDQQDHNYTRFYICSSHISITVISSTLPEATAYKQVSIVQSSGLNWAINIHEKIQNTFNKARLIRFGSLFSVRMREDLKTFQLREEIFFIGSFCSSWGFLGLVLGKAGVGGVLIFFIYLFGLGIWGIGLRGLGCGGFCIARA